MPSVPKPNFKRKSPKRSVRNEFSKSVRDEINKRDQGQCQNCLGRGEEIHHVMFRSRGGRGVITNGLTLCRTCHTMLHMDSELADFWIEVYTDRFGPNFFKDEWDVR